MSFRLGNMDCIPFLIWYTQFFFISILGLISKLLIVETLVYVFEVYEYIPIERLVEVVYYD